MMEPYTTTHTEEAVVATVMRRALELKGSVESIQRAKGDNPSTSSAAFFQPAPAQGGASSSAIGLCKEGLSGVVLACITLQTELADRTSAPAA